MEAEQKFYIGDMAVCDDVSSMVAMSTEGEITGVTFENEEIVTVQYVDEETGDLVEIDEYAWMWKRINY